MTRRRGDKHWRRSYRTPRGSDAWSWKSCFDGYPSVSDLGLYIIIDELLDLSPCGRTGPTTSPVRNLAPPPASISRGPTLLRTRPFRLFKLDSLLHLFQDVRVDPVRQDGSPVVCQETVHRLRLVRLWQRLQYDVMRSKGEARVSG